jgi:hypothetical protein
VACTAFGSAMEISQENGQDADMQGTNVLRFTATVISFNMNKCYRADDEEITKTGAIDELQFVLSYITSP